MINIFLLLLFFIFIMVAYRNILWGIGAVIVLLPTYLWRFELIIFPTTFLELMVMALFVIWLIKDQRYKTINFSLNKKSKNALPKTLQYLLSLWLMASILALLTNFAWGSLGLWRAYFLEPIMFFLVFVYTVKDKKDFKFIIICLMILLAWLFEIAMYQNFSSWNHLLAYNFPHIKRLTGPFSYPNALSLLTAPLTSLFFGLWVYAKDKIKSVHYLVLAMMGLALAILTISQGAMLAIFISWFICLILAKKWYKYGLSILLVLGMGALLITSTLNFNPRLNLQSSSLDIRFNQWQETGDLLSDNFVLGAGLAGYQKALVKYHQTSWLEIYLYPHNIFLNFWTELGIFGLAVFILLMIYVGQLLYRIFKNNYSLFWPFTLMWSTWLIHGLVDVPYFKNDLSLLFFVMLAFTFLVASSKKNVEI